ncbi:MAG: hypothetical protein D6723_05660 [Acidobacteria bacterium]|nr:MAG: hypothetical protein D6723_05660 [Acidobacteriota bacterium]
MAHRREIIVWIFLGYIIITGEAIPQGIQQLSTLPSCRILDADSDRLEIDVRFPHPTIGTVQLQQTTYRSVSLRGCHFTERPGAPRLPVKGWLVAIPPEARIGLNVVAEEVRTMPIGRLLPAPRFAFPPPDALASFPVSLPAPILSYEEDASIYGQDAFFPSTLVALGDRGWFRDQAYVRLLVRPVQYNPVRGMLRWVRSLRITLTFESASPRESIAESIAPRPENGFMERFYRAAFLNAGVAQSWRRPLEGQSEVSGAHSLAQESPAYKLLVDEDGLYAISYADLQTAGLPVSTIDPRTFKIFNRGKEVAIWVIGEDDGVFNPGDVLLFFGRRRDSKYGFTNVYWLTYGGDRGARMKVRRGDPQGTSPATIFRRTVHREEDHIYRSLVPRREGVDHFYWNFWFPPNVATLTYECSLSQVAAVSFSATLRARLVGLTDIPGIDPDHHLQLFLNDQFLGDIRWDGPTEHLVEVTFPQSLLMEGTNVIRLEAPNDTGAATDQGFVDWFEIDYAARFVAENNVFRFSRAQSGEEEFRITGFTSPMVSIFDITDPFHVERIVNPTITKSSAITVQFRDVIDGRREYLLLTPDRYRKPRAIIRDNPSRLRSTDNGADYLIITHGDFYDAVAPLADWRAAQGLRAMIVDVQDVYDEFNDGLFAPEAIRDFLAYAYANWRPPAPAFVLLVGDGTFDFKDNLGTGERNFIPPFLRMVSPFLGEAASENSYVTVRGDDVLPEMFIGRLPVNTPQEASAVVEKILEYEREVAGDWTRRIMFVADNADRAGPFDLFSDIVADEHLPPEFEAEKIYLNITHPNPDEARQAIRDGINQGRLIVNYVGHSAIQLWAAERLLEVSQCRNDLSSLTNADRWPMVLSLSSVDGFFHFPGFPALSESLLRAKDKGAIGWWGGAGLGLSAGHHLMDVGFFDAVFREGITEIGAAAARGYMELHSQTESFDFLINTYVLFGDPALRLSALQP